MMVHQVTWLRRLVTACLGVVCVPRVLVMFEKLFLPLLLGFVLTLTPATASLWLMPAALWVTAPDTAVVCAAHQVVEAKCTLCNPALIPGFKAMNDWCAGHELPESVCPQCSHGTPEPPPISAEDWCVEHEVPESRCTLCHPELIPGFKAMQDWCAEHQLPESVCPICRGGPVLATARVETSVSETLTAADLAQRVVRFLDPAKETQAGIAVTAIRRGDFQAVVEAPARVAFNADRVAQLRAVVDGVVQKIHVPLGAEVRAGSAVFDLVSPEIASVQARLRAAQTAVRVAERQLQRQQQLAARDIVGAWDVEQAELSLETARGEVAAATTTLQTVGATAEGPPGIFSVRAPISGTLVRREAVAGARAGHDHPLGLIVDTRSLWILADVAENDAAQLEIGATLAFTADDGQSVQGRVTWLAAEVDADSRTVLVRAEVANPGGLRANQFGRARLTLPETQNTWLVPAAAVQHYQNQALVFVRRAQGLYQPHAVQPLEDGDWVAVRADLNAGDQVVTTGAVLLLTEMLPGSIGAGCCEVEPLGDTEGGR